MREVFFLTFLLCSFILLSCTNSLNKKEKEVDLQWIVGSWHIDMNDMQMTEIWTKQNDTIFLGHSYIVNQKSDTIFNERVTLFHTPSKTVYSVKVANEPKIDFILGEIKKDTLIFENKEHDFPQRIMYAHIHQDSMFARIDGTKNGKYLYENFLFYRSKNKQ